MKATPTTFAAAGDIFNDLTNKLAGGVNNQNQILKELSQVQNGIQNAMQANPGDFTGVSSIHAQNIIDQLNLEMSAVKSYGSDPFAAKYINDVHRDLIDIVQGDTQLQALATQGGHNGFAAVPDLLVKPTPFVGSAEQTTFMQNFVTTTQDFATRAVALADNHGSAADVQQLVGEVQAFESQANTFTNAQGGIYSARFNNEFGDNGVNGTASRALIDGLQTGNADKVHAAAEVLTANAADVSGNMLPNGSTPLATGNGIPNPITSFAQAGTVFNDATTKLIGGVYDGNRQSIHDDLTATQQGLKDLSAQGQFTGQAQNDVNKIVNLLGKEIGIVDSGDTGAGAVHQLHNIQNKITTIVQNDATLATAAADGGANGFAQLPPTLKQMKVAAAGADPQAGDNGQNQGNGAGTAVAGDIPGNHGDQAHGTDHLAQIFQSGTLHHHA